MASNNYYGFTHGGTMNNVVGTGYVTTPAAAAVSSGYQQQVSQAYSAHRAQGYDQTYAQSSLSSAYAYPRSQAGNMSYTHDTTQYATGAGSGAVMYPYTSNAANTYTNTYNSVVSNYAATALYSQQVSVAPSDAPGAPTAPVYTTGKTGNWNFKKAMKGNRPQKNTTKVTQLHYCEVCKISCAGPQTYKEHLEGQRHKKKEAQLKAGGNANSASHKRASHIAGIALRCELCDVTCTGNDAYAAHIRGSKHQKVVKLHTKLGKPIPNVDPVVVNQKGTSKPYTPPQIPTAAGKIKVLGTPRINFVGGGRLHTTAGMSETKEDEKQDESMQQQQTQTAGVQSHQGGATLSQEQPSLMELDRTEAMPVGQDYVEEVKNETDGKVVNFHCKLCDCRFNDPNAKEMHLKGRRHRLAYKKKVDPNLVVDIKPSLKHRKLQDMKASRYFQKQQREHYWNDWYAPPGNRYNYEPRHMPPPPPPPPHVMPPPPGFGGGAGMMSPPMMSQYRRGPPGVTSWDDTHILQKHSEIIPKEEELDDIYHVVMITEKALKLVSDKLADEDSANVMNEIIQKELGEELGISAASKDSKNGDTPMDDSDKSQQDPSGEKNSEEASSNRILKGLMRVGLLAKSLLLSGDREVDLVVMCSEKPTKQLLQRVVDHLPQQLQTIASSETFQIVMKPQDAGLCVISTTEPKITVNVTLTSPSVREASLQEGVAQPEMVKEPKQMLERQKCLEALAALRHAKWYQARVANLHPCPMIIRLLRDLCRRLPTWSKLSLWAVELLVERVVVSAGEGLTPGEALRHTFEAIASGLLLPGEPGLLDPCEKEPVDALEGLSPQDREDITASAQHALRLIAFRQIYKILGVDPVPQRQRKRHRDVEMDEQDSGDSANKKDKKEEQQPDNFAEDESLTGITSNDNVQQFSDESASAPIAEPKE